MNLAAIISTRGGVSRTFRTVLEREEEAWRDHRFQAIRERHLAPLIAANDRFDRELAAVAASVKTARRRLDESR